MLWWALIFFLASVLAAILGFGGLAMGAAAIAKTLFYVFLGLFLVSVIAHFAYNRGPTATGV